MDDASGPDGVLNSGESAVFRAHLFVTEKDLALPGINIHFAAIKDEGSIYVNGELAGETHGSPSPSFDIRKRLHAGVNTVAVIVTSHGDSGGLANGVSVEIQGEPTEAHWQRSTFNGLAQVIVQSDKQPGEIKLTASADGLQPATVTISSEPATPRPAVP